MPKFHNELKIKASPEKAWAIVGDLAGVDRWIPGITSVRVEGHIKRICTFASGAVQHEEIGDYSNIMHSYRYAIEGSPLPVKNNRGSFAVKPDGKESVIVWDAEFDVLDPAREVQIIQMWKEATKEIFSALRKLIED